MHGAWCRRQELLRGLAESHGRANPEVEVGHYPVALAAEPEPAADAEAWLTLDNKVDDAGRKPSACLW